MKKILIYSMLVLFLVQCTFQKRIYRRGYYVQSHSSHLFKSHQQSCSEYSDKTSERMSLDLNITCDNASPKQYSLKLNTKKILSDTFHSYTNVKKYSVIALKSSSTTHLNTEIKNKPFIHIYSDTTYQSHNKINYRKIGFDILLYSFAFSVLMPIPYLLHIHDINSHFFNTLLLLSNISAWLFFAIWWITILLIFFIKIKNKTKREKLILLFIFFGYLIWRLIVSVALFFLL